VGATAGRRANRMTLLSFAILWLLAAAVVAPFMLWLNR